MQLPILSVRNLSIPLQIGTQIFNVVQNLSFDLHLGQTLALVGESGCGKTMTALSLLNILPYPVAKKPQGEIYYRNKNLLTSSEKEWRALRGAKIAMIFQNPSSALNPVYTIGSQLIEVVENHLALFGKEAYVRCQSSLKEVGILPTPEFLNAYPHQLSGGMKQRVMIAMALLCEPDILIADEPTTALDVTIQAQVLELIRHIQLKKGMAVLLITHDMGIVAEIADEVIVMYAAQGVEKTAVLNLFQQQAHPYTQGLFKARPHLQRGRELLQPILGSVPALNHYPSGCHFHPRCPYKMLKCSQTTIPLFAIGDKQSHEVRCLLYDQTVESTQKLEEKHATAST